MSRALTRIATALTLGALLTSAACIHTSPNPEDEARDIVHGDAYELRLKSGDRFYGELLAVTDTTLVFLIGRRVSVAPLSTVTSLGFGWREIAAPGGVISNADFMTLRHRSRFPYGITKAAMAGLLNVSGQSLPDTLGKAP